jgi:hypothetical protein
MGEMNSPTIVDGKLSGDTIIAFEPEISNFERECEKESPPRTVVV